MVGWLTSIPADKSQTQASPPSWLATTLSRRNRTGSDSAFSVVRQLGRPRFSREWLAHNSGRTAHTCSSVNGNS